jgi:hypothetical protein
MSLRYCHTLIPCSSNIVARADQIQCFFAAMASIGVVGNDHSLALRKPSGKSREFRNPFTGAIVVRSVPERVELHDVSCLAGTIGTLKEYEAEMASIGIPKTPPLPIEFDGPYHVGVTCHVSSTLRSMSDLHEESESAAHREIYGEPCDGETTLGLFSNPHTLEVIEVADAGCARFWIEFELGKSLFPAFDRADLNFLNPTIVAEAEGIFGQRFAQGCNWG